jgi:transcriptional regulator with XRE-family HTH domain
MSQPRRWSADRARQIGERVKRLRGNRTAQWLADRCTELGHPMSRSAIAKLENGRREDLGQSEIDILARALGLSPVLLLFPVGEVTEVEVLPGDVRDTWDALRWFTGESPQEFSSREELEAWHAANEPLRLHRVHQRVLDELRETRRRMNHALAARVLHDSTDSERETAARVMDTEASAVRQFEERLSELRQQMRNQGITPPPLPDGLTYLDPEVSAP